MLNDDEDFLDDDNARFIEPNAELNTLTQSIIGAAIEVHRTLGPGLDEALYKAAIVIEFRHRNISFARQVVVEVTYKGEIIGEKRLDFIVAGKIVVELKAVEQLAAVHKAQVNTYLKISRLTLGLLLNFNTVVLKDGVRRIIRS